MPSCNPAHAQCNPMIPLIGPHFPIHASDAQGVLDPVKTTFWIFALLLQVSVACEAVSSAQQLVPSQVCHVSSSHHHRNVCQPQGIGLRLCTQFQSVCQVQPSLYAWNHSASKPLVIASFCERKMVPEGLSNKWYGAPRIASPGPLRRSRMNQPFYDRVPVPSLAFTLALRRLFALAFALA